MNTYGIATPMELQWIWIIMIINIPTKIRWTVTIFYPCLIDAIKKSANIFFLFSIQIYIDVISLDDTDKLLYDTSRTVPRGVEHHNYPVPITQIQAAELNLYDPVQSQKATQKMQW